MESTPENHARLVNTVKFASRIEGKTPDSEREKYFNPNRVKRIKLLAVAREVTLSHGVTGCLLHPVNLLESVDVTYSDERRTARIGNVMTCKSVWACPVCAEAITRFRASLLMGGMDSWAAQGNTAALATYTIQHNVTEDCKTVLKRLQAAYRRFKSGRAYQALKKNHAVAGGVRALEVTFGESGWHWHIHEIFFLTGQQAARFEPMLTDLRAHWLDAVRQVGGYATQRHGFALSKERRAAFDYVAKFGHGEQQKLTWNAAREVVRSPAKNMAGDKVGAHPFTFLETAITVKGDRGIWNEYVRATKGVNQLRYGRGTTALLGLPANEAEAAEAFKPDILERLTAQITSRGWYRLNARNGRVLGEFYAVADTGDAALLLAWLDDNDVEMASRAV